MRSTPSSTVRRTANRRRSGKLNPANADGYTSALTGAHYFVLSTKSLGGVIAPVA
jgi:hypothetical protein